MVDFIGKYENLYSDFEKIKIKLNIDEVNLPYENSNKVRKKYKDICFTKETVQLLIYGKMILKLLIIQLNYKKYKII